MERPWCCPVPWCRVVHQLKDHEARPLDEAQPGESWVCFGRMTEKVPFAYDGVEHEGNDLRTCQYSALKGLVGWQENEGDWAALGDAYATALRLLRKEAS